MPHRLPLLVCLFLYLNTAWAETGNPSWSCEQSSEDKQWRCQTTVVPNAPPPAELPESPEIAAEQEVGSYEMADLNAPIPPLTRPANPYSPPRTKTAVPGWTCKPGADDLWECSLVGRDPEGQPTLMGEQESVVRNWLGNTYDQKQERIFTNLLGELQYNPWAACSVSGGPAVRPDGLPGLEDRETAPMYVGSDYSEIFDTEITSFYGNVDLSRGDQKVKSDMATYDSEANTLDVQGGVYYSDSELALFSQSGFLNLHDQKTNLRDVLFIVPDAPLRGSSEVIYRDSPTFSYYKGANFTSCPPNNQDWVMHAKRLKMNTKTGKAAAKHAWLEFKGIPFLYSPYISFPLDDRRLTGFLSPTWGITGRSGFDIQVPFYWNIAPNYDALFWGRYLGDRGPLFGSKWRYLTEMFEGSLELEILPNDDAAGESRGFATTNQTTNLALANQTPLPTTKSFRGAARFKNTARFNPYIASDIDLNYVSDPYYFDDLGNSLNISTESFLRSFANIRYNQLFGSDDEDQTTVSFLTQVENFQVIDINQTSKPYQRLPQILLNVSRDSESLPLEMDLSSEFVYFQKKVENNFFGLELDDFNTLVNQTTPVTGSRFNIHPSVSFPVETPGSYITPKIGFQYTHYSLTDQLPGRASNISRALPIISLDTGLIFEKAFGSGDSGLIHTLEPRLFYAYIPFDDQQDIPLFDTGEFDFNGSQLFRENRFTGTDRIGDTNQLSYALTSRLLSNVDGNELLNFTIGQIVYFQDRKVVLDSTRDPETDSFSNIIVGLNGRLHDYVTFTSGLQWDPNANELARIQAGLRYRGPNRQIVNIGYRFREDEFNNLGNISREGINQSDFSFLWPISKDWSIVGRWQYSFEHELTLESFLGLELDSCCWRFRIIGRRFVSNIDRNTDNNNNIEPDNAVFFQFELKGLSSFGEDVEQFLERQINGYYKQ